MQPCPRLGHAAAWSLATTTGYPDLDVKLRHETASLHRAFGVSSSLFVFNDFNGPNAYSSTHPQPTGPSGTIFLGKQLLDLAHVTPDMGETAVVLVLAHEWAHVLQVVAGFPSHLSGKHRELHADLLAGWYLGRRSFDHRLDLLGVAHRTYRQGRYPYIDIVSHGAPETRTAAMLFGYRHARYPLEQVYGGGLRFVASLTRTAGIAGPRAPMSASRRVRSRIGLLSMTRAANSRGGFLR